MLPLFQYLKHEAIISITLALLILCSYFKGRNNFDEIVTDKLQNGVEHYTVQVIFPREDQLVILDEDERLKAQSVYSLPQAEDLLRRKKLQLRVYHELSIRKIHKQFSEIFGGIHRVYVGRDYHELHHDAKRYI